MLLAGDIFDGPWRDFNTALFFAQRMGQLREADIQVYFVTGNHDAASTISKHLKPPDNVRVLDNTEPESIDLPELGVVIHGQSYQQREVREDLAARYPIGDEQVFNIGILHTALTGRTDHESYAPTSLEVLVSKGYEYWALGHVHQREVVSRDPWIVFSGAIQGRHIREQGPKGCTLVQVEQGQVSEVTHCDLDVLRWQVCELDLKDCTCEEHVWAAVRSGLEAAIDSGQGRPVAVRLQLYGQTSMHNWLHHKEQQVQEECRTRAAGLGDIWLEKIKINTQPVFAGGAGIEQDSPLAGLLQCIEDLSLDPSCQDQISELTDMLSKLPPEIQGKDNQSFDLSDPVQLKQIQDEVKELLLSRMLQGVRS